MIQMWVCLGLECFMCVCSYSWGCIFSCFRYVSGQAGLAINYYFVNEWRNDGVFEFTVTETLFTTYLQQGERYVNYTRARPLDISKLVSLLGNRMICAYSAMTYWCTWILSIFRNMFCSIFTLRIKLNGNFTRFWVHNVLFRVIAK